MNELNFASPSSRAPAVGIASGLPPMVDSSVLTALLDALPVGVLMCGPTGVVQVANAAARRELAAGTLLGTDDRGAMVATSATVQTSLRKAIVAAVHLRRHAIIDAGTPSCPLLLAVAPLPAGAGAHEGALLLFGRRNVCSEPALQLVGQLYGLTPSEREVLGGLLRGHTVSELAETRARKLSTLRSQVHAILTKFGVRRIEDAVRHVALMPWVLDAVRASEGRVPPPRPVPPADVVAGVDGWVPRCAVSQRVLAARVGATAAAA